ncbi:hypothetical protein LOTGIDRAFT_139693, partial [Lottia gigantea]
FDHGHLSRTACCRVYDVLTESLPPPYHINHPRLYNVTIPLAELYPNGVHITSLSVNWSAADDKIEITDGITGKTTPLSPFKSGKLMASRLCKAAFLSRHKDMARMSQKQSLEQVPTYEVAKRNSVHYQQAKQALHEHFIVSQIGAWIKKPKDMDNFTK